MSTLASTTPTTPTSSTPSADGTWEKSQHENDGLSRYGGRDNVGYASRPPQVKWHKGAKVALNFVINYEEGGESCILHGDKASEKRLSDMVDAKALEGKRNINMESLWEYGARAGFWRLHRLFTQKKIPCTVYAVGMALERNPAVCQALKETPEWEVASHGYRWIDYKEVDEEMEIDHIKRAVAIHERLLGKRPVGIYQGNASPHTRRLIVDNGGFKYDSDAYSDDLPYWTNDYGRPHLIIPYTLTENDMRFVTPNNFSTGADFSRHLKDTLKYMVEEGRAGNPRLMSVGLHCRLARPGRVAALAEFLDVARGFGKDVWICTREQIADHWFEHHYPMGGGTPLKALQDGTAEGEAKGDKPSS